MNDLHQYVCWLVVRKKDGKMINVYKARADARFFLNLKKYNEGFGYKPLTIVRMQGEHYVRKP